MKKLFLIAILATSLASSASTPNETKINYRIETSFRDEFSDAKNVQWSKSGSYVKALFVHNNKQTEAFFTSDGELVGSSHALSLDDLSTSAKRSFAKKYSDYTVKEVIEFRGAYETAYFISAEKENQKIILKVVGGQVSVYHPELG